MEKQAKKTKTGKFLKIACPRCNCPQIIYGKSSLKIKCGKCNLLLTKPQGGKTKIRALVKEIM